MNLYTKQSKILTVWGGLDFIVGEGVVALSDPDEDLGE